MSKKTRKKSPKSFVGKTRTPTMTTAKRPTSKSRKPTANKSSKNAKDTQTGSPVPKASHMPASKSLKSAGDGKPVRRAAAESKPKATNPSLKNAGESAVARSILAEGVEAPSFRLQRDGGSTVSLADHAGRKLVLFFYPRADTPGCTREAIDFTRLASSFAEAQISVIGVSADPPKTQEAFRNKHKLAVPLASDETHQMLRAYGVWGEKSMYGRTFLGILRTTVLIGADGRILKIWRNVKVDGHAEEVLAAARAA
ncbi:MAG: peroxiredoxin [Bradyrhizobium sp.]